MTSQNLALISMTLEDKLDESTQFFALNQCENLDDSAMSSLSVINFKSPVTGLLWHLFLGFFGVGRFYKGNILLGLSYIASFVLFCALIGYDEDLAALVFLLYSIAYGVDFFLIYKGIQKDNWQKLQTFLLAQNSHNEPVQNTKKRI